MDTDQIRTQVATFFTTGLPGRVDVEVLGDDDPLFSSGMLDSIAFLSLVDFLEETFDLSFSVEDLDAEYFDSLSRIADLVSTKQQQE